MTKVYVTHTQHIDHEMREDVEWGSWSRDSTFTVGAASLTEPSSWGWDMFDLCCNVEEGDTVYALVLIYGTGDSFGQASGEGEVLWVFREKVLAERAEAWLNENPEKYSIEFWQEDLTKVQLSNPASGYFEHIEYTRIESLIVGG